MNLPLRWRAYPLIALLIAAVAPSVVSALRDPALESPAMFVNWLLLSAIVATCRRIPLVSFRRRSGEFMAHIEDAALVALIALFPDDSALLGVAIGCATLIVGAKFPVAVGLRNGLLTTISFMPTAWLVRSLESSIADGQLRLFLTGTVVTIAYTTTTLILVVLTTWVERGFTKADAMSLARELPLVSLINICFAMVFLAVGTSLTGLVGMALVIAFIMWLSQLHGRAVFAGRRLEGVLAFARQAHGSSVAEIEQQVIAAANDLLFTNCTVIRDAPPQGIEVGVELTDGTGRWLVLERIWYVDPPDFSILEGLGTVGSELLRSASLMEQIHHDALHDPLTGLANRRLLESQLDLEIARALRSDDIVVVLYVDLDDFKRVNDELGHEVGDELLRQVADRLRGASRRGDLIARIGGDEFVLMITQLPSRQESRTVVERVMGHFDTPFVIGTKILPMRPSLGMAVLPDDGVTSRELLAKADGAMYQSKRTHKTGGGAA